MFKLNSIQPRPLGYTSATPDAPCGQEALADLLLEYRRFETGRGPDGWALPPISESGIRKLVGLAFYASMAPEEGRSPRFKAVCREDAGTSVARLQPVPIDEIDVLRRLAPACTHAECALLVAEREGGLWCDGVANIGPMGYETIPGRPEFVGVGGPPTFRIRVEGPGHLVAGIGGVAYEMQAGTIRRLSPYFHVPGVFAFREQLAQRLEQELLHLEGDDAQTFFGGSRYSTPIPVILSRMLRVAVEARHGGAFVIIPSDSCNPLDFGIKPKYQAEDLDLGADMVRFWSACAAAQRKYEQQGYTDAIRQCNVTRAKMLTDAEAVGNLSCVDGCVVLNRRLQLCGFGANIGVSEEEAKGAPRPFMDQEAGEEWKYETFMNGIGGTRHQSAARLCKAHAGVLVFIASQDGELKTFYSDEDKVSAFGPLYLPLFSNDYRS
jgi:hypothetical protein